MSVDLTPTERDKLIRTVIGEAGGDGLDGMIAVASVLNNRASSGAFGSTNPALLAIAHNTSGYYAFSANADQAHGGNTQGQDASPDSSIYKKAAQAVDGVLNGTYPDPTGGATYYYAPSGMNGKTPTWIGGKDQTTKIGGHIFYADPNITLPPSTSDSLGSPLPASNPFVSPTPMPGRPAMLESLADNPLPAPSPLVAPSAALTSRSVPTYRIDTNGNPIIPPSNDIPPLPIPRPTPPQIAPTPFPGRPPDIMPSTAGVLVNLNGKMVKPGTYASPSNPGSTFTVADDGTGKAIVTNNDPGFMNIAKMGPGTIAGSIVGKTIGDATTAAKASVGQAANNVGASASQLGSNIAGFGGSLLSGIGGLFNRPQSNVPSFVPTGSSWVTPKPPVNIPSVAYPGDLSAGGSNASVYPGDLSGGGIPQVPQAAPKVPNTIGSYTPNATLPSFMPQGNSWLSPLSPALGTPPPSSATLAGMGTPPGTPLNLQSNSVPPVPMPTPSWLQPVMPQSAVFGSDPLSQIIAKSKIGPLIPFLGGSQNNYSYLQPAADASGQSAASLHAALMAQQAKAPGYFVTNSNGTPAKAMNGQPIRSNPYVNSFGMVI